MKERLSTEHRARLGAAWNTEIEASRRARQTGDVRGEWSHLERAHVLSQPMAWPHVRTHAAMFAVATRRRDVHELVGQMFRIVVAGPGSLTGRYPAGNTGGADVSAFTPMDVPSDLRAFFDEPALEAS